MKAGTLGKTVKSLLLHDEVLQAAEKHGKTPAQVLLRWATQRGVAVIPKSTQTLRMVENLESMNFQLSEEEIYELSGLDCKLRFNDPYLETGNKDLRIFT
jgi:D-xylose reductase